MYDIEELLRGSGWRRYGLTDRTTFERIATPDEATEKDLAFFRGSYLRKHGVGAIGRTAAGVILIPLDYGYWAEAMGQVSSSQVLYAVKNPRYHVAKMLSKLVGKPRSGFNAPCFCSPEANVGPFTSIGPYTVLGKCSVGENCVIGSHTVIGDAVEIRDNVRVMDHCVIGKDGFHFVRDGKYGKLQHFPHVGRVVIEDDVEIFPFANVDRGTLGETRICRGSKIDHYVHVSHNVWVGERTVLTAGVVLCGGSRIGHNSWAGIGSMVKEKVKVGNEVTLGMGAVVVKDVPDGQTVVGVPAKELKKDGVSG